MPVLTQETLQPFYEYLRFEKRYSAHTLTAYRADLGDFSDYLDKHFGSIAITEINHGLVRSWLASLKDRGLTAKSINRKISGLRSLFKYLLKTGVITSTPMTKVISPKIGKRLPEFVKQEEAAQLLDNLERNTEDWKSLNAQMLITIFYATGMRLSELLNLREKQVDFAKSQIKVLGKGNKERIIPVSRELTRRIREYIIMKQEYFAGRGEPAGGLAAELLVTEKGKKIYPRYAWALVNQYLGEASSLSKKSPHVLRHSFATHLVNNGASLNAVKELLGHSSLAATQVYTHNSIEKLKDIHKKAHPKA